MADLGNLHFGVHLQDMTDADADKIKKKLENLSVSLKIDGNNMQVSNADIIKKQLEDAVKSVNVSSVKVNVDAVKQQIEGATQNLIPQVKVTLLKDNLSTDIQSYLDTKSFNVKISITKAEANNALKNLGTVAVPVLLKIDKKVALDGLKKSLLNMTVPIGIRMKSSKDLAKDIQERMKNTSVKISIDANRNNLRSNVAQALRGQTFKANLDLVVQKASVQQAIRQAFAQAGLNYNTSASDVRQNLIDTRNLRTDAYVKAQKALEDYRRAQIGSAQAANQQSSAMERVNRTAEKQKGIMASVRENVANAYALYRVGRFLNTAIQIGGEFQQQHVALQTIIGDADKANALFERIKNLAIESPFKMLDLTKYTKQLAAFSIPYEEMFDTLKRFGDLSAGLGVDMGRIILAYGQVRSAEFLKGTELRQFTEVGIPLVTELARRYTDLRGVLVSVGDVYDMISKKQVPFSDVKDVLWDLTSEGGKFFNMQAVLTDTLKGKLDKLADSYEIFLSEIANSNNDVLGGTLDLLADTLKHWELIQDVVMSAVSAYGVYKATLLAVAAVQKTVVAAEALQKLIISYQFLHNTTKAATVAQLAFNEASKANPYVLLASGLATIAASMGLLFNNTNDTAEATAKLNAKLQEEQENIESSKRNADKLVSVMTKEGVSMNKRVDSYNRLKTIYPTLFENMTQEQAMLLKEAELRGMVAEAAKKETKEKLEASLIEAKANIGKAQKEVDYWNKYRVFRDGEETTNKPIKESYDKALSDLISAQNVVATIEESIELLDKKAAEQAKRVASRWFQEAKDYVNSLPEEYKNLMPEEGEERESYFERIGKTVSDLDGKIKKLNKDSSAAQEILGGYETERDYANNIYTQILGGYDEAQQRANEESRKNQEKQDKQNEKDREDAAKRLVSAYANALKAEISKIGSQWNLFKDLVETTGNESVSMNLAFGGKVSFKSQLEQIEKLIDNEIKKNGLGISVADLLSMNETDIANKINSKEWGEDMVKNLTALTNAYNAENAKIKEESIRNFIEIVKNSNDFAQQIENIERKLQKDLADLRSNAEKGGLSKEDLSRREAELINRAEEEKTKIRFEEFKKSSDWVKVFDDLDRVSDTTLDNMISKIEEFAKQAHLSEEVTKQLVEAMAKLRDEAIKRNPFEGFKDAWNRASYWRNYDVNAAYNNQFNDKTGKFEKKLSQEQVDNNLAEANDDLKDSALAVAEKFQAVANAADLLSGLFENMGLGASKFMSAISDVVGGATSGAQAGAGIAAAFGATGPWGAIAGAAVGVLSALFAQVDKSLQRSIEASERREKEIGNVAKNLEKALERNMGGLFTMRLDDKTSESFAKVIENYGSAQDALKAWNSGEVNMDLYRQIREFSHLQEDTIETIREALSEDSYFDAQLAALKVQRDEVQKQMQLEDEKKKTDKDKMLDYEQQIHELDDAINHFAEDMANALYGIDFKDWSEQLAESLVDAWASGEDAVQAYRKTVNDILKDLGVSIISQKIIEPLLDKTMDDFLSQFEKDNGILTDSSLEILAGMAGQAEYAASATEAYLEGLKKLGIDLSETSEEVKSGLSKGIQSVTEDTADLLASYLNAIRADVSVDRSLMEKLIGEDVPRLSYIAEAQLRELNQIVANTKRNADAADSIRESIRSVIGNGNGGKAIRIL